MIDKLIKKIIIKMKIEQIQERFKINRGNLIL